MNRKIEQHYTNQFKKFELTWTPFFHYGIFDGDDDWITAQKRTLDIIAKLGNVKTSSTVLDVGSGIGSTPLYLAEKYGCTVVGIDPVKDQIAYSQEKVSAMNLDRLVSFHLGSAEKIPFEEESFDTVISNEVFCHVADKRRALSECYRVLRQGGFFILTDLFDRVGDSTTTAFHAYLKHILPMLNREPYETLIRSSDFELTEVRDLGKELPKNYKKALIAIKSDKDQIVKQFGEAEYQSTKAFYELCLTDDIRKNIGWAYYVCRKAISFTPRSIENR